MGPAREAIQVSKVGCKTSNYFIGRPIVYIDHIIHNSSEVLMKCQIDEHNDISPNLTYEECFVVRSHEVLQRIDSTLN